MSRGELQQIIKNNFNQKRLQTQNLKRQRDLTFKNLKLKMDRIKQYDKNLRMESKKRLAKQNRSFGLI